MPDKEPKETIDKQEVSPGKGLHDKKTSYKSLIITLSIVGVVLLCLLVGGGVLVLRMIANRANARNQPTYANIMPWQNARSNFGYGTSVQTEINNDNTVTTTVYTYQTGVVIAVNSDNIVIAGNGKQTTIKTNSSTTYDNNQKPVVNDTVRIAGTTDNGAITATEIAVND